MIIGMLFIVAGILIAVYPPLLSLIVASMLIFLGIIFFAISYHYKRISKHVDNPYMNFFIRF